MAERNCMALLEAKFSEGKNVCVGLDTSPKKISQEIDKFLREKHHIPPSGSQGVVMRRFNEEIVRATYDLVCAYKYNYWFYANQMYQGLQALESSIAFGKEIAPDIPQILDYKGGDVGESAKECAEFAFKKLGVHAVTVSPWGGDEDGLDLFFEYEDKMIFVWCKGSNKGAKKIQDLPVFKAPAFVGNAPCGENRYGRIEDVLKLYLWLARKAHQCWNVNGNCGLVVGGTYPEELKRVREIAGDMPILVPGIGAQGGDLKEAVKAAGAHTFFNSSRGIIYASTGSDFAEAARKEVERLQNTIHSSCK